MDRQIEYESLELLTLIKGKQVLFFFFLVVFFLSKQKYDLKRRVWGMGRQSYQAGIIFLYSSLRRVCVVLWGDKVFVGPRVAVLLFMSSET